MFLFRGIGGLTSWLSNLFFVVGSALAAIYAFNPDLRLWVETEVIGKKAWYYVGEVDGVRRVGKIEDVEFYSSRWYYPSGRIQVRNRENQDNIWQAIRAIEGEVVVKTENMAGPVMARVKPDPIAASIGVAQEDTCYYVHKISCRLFSQKDGGRHLIDDPSCSSEDNVWSEWPDVETVSLWIEATSISCS